MSVVHDNLSRKDRGRTRDVPSGAQSGADDPSADEVSEFDREIARKERLLTEGIRRLQEHVVELTGQLEATRKDLEQEREDNIRLRQGAMSDLMSPKRESETPEQSLLSRALG